MSTPKTTKLTCFDVADYFLSLVDEESGDSISNLKLQKLVYYAQGLHLACYDAPLFSEDILAWAHGPVVRELYDRYKSFGSNPLPPNTDMDFDKYDGETQGFLDEIYQMFGQYSAWKLREMTHQEAPWVEAHKRRTTIISHAALKSHFKEFVE